MDDLKDDHSGGPIMKRMVSRTAIFGHGGGKGGVRLAATAAVEADMLWMTGIFSEEYHGHFPEL